MDEPQLYKDIRPYDDSEVPAVIKEIINDPHLKPFFTSVFQYFNFDKFVRHLALVKTVYEFQSIFSFLAMKSIVLNSIDKFSQSGIDKLSVDKSYLLISNHRDIVLDSALMNFVLFENGHRTCQTAIGDNLYVSPLISHLLKLNKSFTVKRNVQPRAVYEYSVTLSQYIKYVLTERNESAWIAQREGRAKDGNDRTQIGLLKMLMMCIDKSEKEKFFDLNITPVAVSYQYDPCDVMKAVELYMKANNQPFEKTPQMDYNSMINGIIGHKGNFHIAFCKPLTTADLAIGCSALTHNEWVKCIADLIDYKIHTHYMLWDTNYIAYDIINEGKQFSSHYSVESKDAFVDYLRQKITQSKSGIPSAQLLPILLNMYAFPVKNFLNYQTAKV